MRQEPISVDDIIERRKRENPKLRTKSLKRKRDDTVEYNQDNTMKPSESPSTDGERTNQFDESEEEGVPAILSDNCCLLSYIHGRFW